MAETTLTTQLPLDPEAAMALAERAGARLAQYDFKGGEGPVLKWERGFGLTNPQTVTARFSEDGSGGTTVAYTVSILALMDPFGFTRESCERFIAELQAPHALEADGVALPEVPRDKKGMTTLIVSLVFVGLLFVCGFGALVMAAIFG